MNRSLLASVGGVALVLGALACDNSQLPTLNKNPNNPTTAPAGPLFTNAARTTISRWLGSGAPDLRGTEFVTQHLGEAQYPNEDQYNRLQSGDTQGTFNNPYTSELMDFKKVIAAGQAANDPSIWGPATVMQVYGFANLTDMFGDVPYSQSLAADSDGGSLAPAYDKQQDIYTSLLQRLTDAATAMEGATGAPSALGSYDIVYNGNLNQWIKLANSMRLRLALRMVNKDPSTASAQLTAAINDPGGLIVTNDDNAMVSWPGDGVYDNPWADNFQTRDDERMSNTLMDIMLADDDPRVPVYAQPVQDSTLYPNGYGGMPNGLDQLTATPYVTRASRPGLLFYPGATAYGPYGTTAGLKVPSIFFTAAETNFILAEVKERGLAPLDSSAASYYAAGIAASMDQWGVTSLAANSYIGSVPYAGGTAGLTQIATQKWVALFGDGAQAWAEWRRTCVPVTAHAGPAAFVPFIPRRFEYSQTEYAVNEASITAALADMGGADSFATRMWWDQAPDAAPTHTNSCNEP